VTIKYRYWVTETWGDVPDQISRLVGEPDGFLLYPENRGQGIRPAATASVLDDGAGRHCGPNTLVRDWGFKPSQILTWCKPPQGIGPGGAFSKAS
jgi:hypothetical protein